MRHSFFLLAPVAALLLAGCASKEMVVVLPAADGHIGGVVVESRGRKVVLDRAYEADNPGDSQASEANPEQVKKDFADVLDARPIPPGHHKLLFKTDSDEMTDVSKDEFNTQVFADVDSRKVAEIVIIGHTDNTGQLEYNDGLSRDRAEAIKKLLLQSQKDQEKLAHMSITTAGRGQRDDPDAPNKPDPDQRYVEIIVQ